MALSKINLDVDENTTFSYTFTHYDSLTNLPIDITGYAAEAVVRRSFGDQAVLLSLSSVGPNAKITLGGTNGLITIHISPTDTLVSSMSDPWITGVFSLLIKDPQNNKTKIAEGFININRTSSLTI